MKEILINSEFKNNYLYSSYKNQIIYIHPLIKFIIENFEKKDFLKWLEGFERTNYINITNLGKFSKNDLKYYYNKYLMYKRNDFFKSVDLVDKTSGRIEKAHQIESFLANTDQVVFEVTDGCNLKCKYCSYGELYSNYDIRNNKSMKFEYGRNLLNYLIKFWKSNLNKSYNKKIGIGFYGGEPLLNFEFIEQIVGFLDNIKLKNSKFIYSMTTNGVLLDKHMDFLVKNQFKILVSLDGNQDNNQYRVFANGRPSFDKLIRNLKRILNKYPRYFKENIQFNSVLHNKNSFGEVFNFFKNTFNKYSQISELSTIGISLKNQKEFWQTYKNRYESLYQTVEESCILNELFLRDPLIFSLWRTIETYSGYNYQNYHGLFFNNNENKVIPTGTCLPFTRKLFLTVNGKILPCERVGQKDVLGTVDRHGVYLDFNFIKEYYNNLYDKMNKQCVLCYDVDNCQKCIFQYDNFENIECEYFKDYSNSSKNFSKLITLLEKSPVLYNKITNIKNYEE